MGPLEYEYANKFSHSNTSNLGGMYTKNAQAFEPTRCDHTLILRMMARKINLRQKINLKGTDNQKYIKIIMLYHILYVICGFQKKKDTAK